MLTLGVPTSPGGPAGLSELTLTLPYNDFEAATALFEQQGNDIAGLIIEPVVGNANCIPPREGYLQHLRELETQGLLEDANGIMERVHGAGSRADAVKGASYIQENSPEKVEIKRALFTELDAVAEPDAVIGIRRR
ncbi:hypothetical protein G6F68_017438 [Rhizopus microsporus]|nr:hypothetical protein G6F68_017438 [Rhizopus microsporus]